jgi:voltage-gated potassium channel
VPINEKGGVAGVFLMFTGITTLGLIAGTLASAFGLSPEDSGAAPSEAGSGADVLAEIRSLRAQVDTLTRQLPPAGPPGDQ